MEKGTEIMDPYEPILRCGKQKAPGKSSILVDQQPVLVLYRNTATPNLTIERREK